MERSKVFKKVVDKAIKNGWKPSFLEKDKVIYEILTSENSVTFFTRRKYQRVRPYSMRLGKGLFINDIIFDHKFAKALWGKEKVIACGFCNELVDKHRRCKTDWCKDNTIFQKMPIYFYHLEKMVICEDRIKYLEKFI